MPAGLGQSLLLFDQQFLKYLKGPQDLVASLQGQLWGCRVAQPVAPPSLQHKQLFLLFYVLGVHTGSCQLDECLPTTD